MRRSGSSFAAYYTSCKMKVYIVHSAFVHPIHLALSPKRPPFTFPNHLKATPHCLSFQQQSLYSLHETQLLRFLSRAQTRNDNLEQLRYTPDFLATVSLAACMATNYAFLRELIFWLYAVSVYIPGTNHIRTRTQLDQKRRARDLERPFGWGNANLRSPSASRKWTTISTLEPPRSSQPSSRFAQHAALPAFSIAGAAFFESLSASPTLPSSLILPSWLSSYLSISGYLSLPSRTSLTSTFSVLVCPAHQHSIAPHGDTVELRHRLQTQLQPCLLQKSSRLAQQARIVRHILAKYVFCNTHLSSHRPLDPLPRAGV